MAAPTPIKSSSARKTKATWPGCGKHCWTAHRQHHGTTEDLVIGFQLTHSGRFCRPQDTRLEPRVAFRHPVLDRKFKVTSDAQVFTDAEMEELIGDYVAAARMAREAGADFVDIKHCHGYLLHEFLGAFTRPGKYGRSFANRTRMLREIVAGIRADGNPIELAVRLSAFDTVPFRPDPARAKAAGWGRAYRTSFPCLILTRLESIKIIRWSTTWPKRSSSRGCAGSWGSRY